MLRIPYDKQPLTVQAQVERLIARGMHVDEPALAEAHLAAVNYYRMSAFWRADRLEDGSFRAGTTFANAVERYDYDRLLRALVFDGVELVEVMLRSRIGNALAIRGGVYVHETDACRAKAFVGDDRGKWVNNLWAETRRSREQFVAHYKERYLEYPRLPVFVASEVMSFGTLSRLFEQLATEYRSDIAGPFGLAHQVLGKWIHSLVYVRNVTAHHGRLWNRTLSIQPVRPRKRFGWSQDAVPMTNRIFAILCVIRDMTRGNSSGELWAARARELLTRAPGPNSEAELGVPLAWESTPLWAPELEIIL